MKAYIPRKAILAGSALLALFSASLYYVIPESSPSSTQHQPVSSSAANSIVVEDRAVSGASQLKNTVHDIQASASQGVIALDNNTAEAKQPQPAAVSDQDLARLEKNNQPALTPYDLTRPTPSSKNVMDKAMGEYADQINPQIVFKGGSSIGELPPEVAPDSHPPSGKNVAGLSQGDNAAEINQQALIDKAKLEGYLLPEVDPGSLPPSSKNVVAEPQGENAQEIIQQQTDAPKEAAAPASTEDVAGLH